MSTEKMPQAIRPFVAMGFDFDPEKVSSENARGACQFCGKVGKLHINTKTGAWDCKSCGKKGNVYTYMQEFHASLAEDAPKAPWDALEADRGLPREALEGAGLAWDAGDERWVLPVFNGKNAMVNLRFFKPGGRLISLPSLGANLYGSEELFDSKKNFLPVWVVEGEWDTIALKEMVKRAKAKVIVVGVPGVDTFAEEWAEWFVGRSVVLCYDADAAGRRGLRRAHLRLREVAKKISMVAWPEQVEEGYDLRDFHREEGTWEVLQEFVQPYGDPGEASSEDEEGKAVALPFLREGTRPSLEETMQAYERNLKMDDDMRDGVRIVYAVVISNQIFGDPLWIHLVAVPGYGKTEIAMSVSECCFCVCRSTLTAHVLVSGFQMDKGRDPSLIPRLFGKTFVVKDWTEILGMHKANKDEICSILRGAYDGRVEKSFGNGIHREYKGFFSMITGVTPRIYAEASSASLGERFLLYRMGSKRDVNYEEAILAAMENVGHEAALRSELQEAAKRFLEVRIDPEDVPQLTPEQARRISSMAQLVSMLRASVERERAGLGERLPYRPQPEVGTRLAKQLKKLLLGLALQHSPPEVTEEDFRIVGRVALDSCVGWNTDTIRFLLESDGKTVPEIAEAQDIPITTLGDQVRQMVLLGVLRRTRHPNPAGTGAPVYRYWVKDLVYEYAAGAGIGLPKTPRRLKAKKGKGGLMGALERWKEQPERASDTPPNLRAARKRQLDEG